MRKGILQFIFLVGALAILSGCADKTKSPVPPVGRENVPAMEATDQNRPENATPSAKTDDGTDGTEEGPVSGTLSTLLGLSRSIHCTYEKAERQGKITADMYIQNDKYSLTVTFPDNGKFYTIGDSNWVYTWNSRVPGGAKMKLEDKDGQTAGDAAADSTNQEYYTCMPWVADASKFIPPADIEFTDETAEIQALEADRQDNPIDQCALCDNLPDPTLKAKCLANAGCE